MKRFINFLTHAFLGASALLFVLTLTHRIPAVSAAPPAPPAPRMSSTNYGMDWNTAGDISGGESASANYKLRGTIGQMAASSSGASANYAQCSGFQCVLGALMRVYLPMISK